MIFCRHYCQIQGRNIGFYSCKINRIYKKPGGMSMVVHVHVANTIDAIEKQVEPLLFESPVCGCSIKVSEQCIIDTVVLFSPISQWERFTLIRNIVECNIMYLYL